MSDLVEWLTNILDEDEALAKHVGVEHGSGWYGGGGSVGSTESMYIAVGPWSGELDAATSTFIAKSGPSAVLADIAAKRAILELHKPTDWAGGHSCPICHEDYSWGPDDGDWPCATVKTLGSAYADRPGYDEAWRP